LDDAAWAIVPPDRTRYILLVGPGNVYLQNALALLPNVELYGTTAETYAATAADPVFDKYDLLVFDGFLPPELPNKAIMAFAPPRTSALGAVSGTSESVGLGQLPLAEPLLRGVDLSRLHVNSTQEMELPEWARSVIPGADGPLLYSGLREGLPTAVFAFDLRQSDLPLQVAWPILISNLATELLGVGGVTLDPLSPAQPIELPISTDAAAIRVTLPDGSVEELAPGATGASTVTFVGTRQLGVYRAELVPAPEPSGSPGAGPTSTATAAPDASASPGQLPEPGTADEPLLFAVDLFSHEESNIRPGDGARLEALGSSADPAAVEMSVARDEFWPWLVLLVLGFLLAEWAVYERDGARRLANGLRHALPARLRDERYRR
ncbi:MAG: hypothetical protein M3253_08335, partial [Chloroflexota bacterium]|nr:hypothetical protein [Chloroflexota bacterium]